MVNNINKQQTIARVLVAPLDWGLGHATRCVPLINALMAKGFEVILAAEKAGAALLQNEFPTLIILPLSGYNVTYSKKRRYFIFKIAAQIFKINAAIKYENKWLANVIAAHKIDVIISDNRFGLHHKNAHCIFITHQLLIKTNNKITEWLLQKINYKHINKFNACWVPDVEGLQNIAGQLAHPKTLPTLPITYIGLLSRFTYKVVEKNIDLLVMLSGPEPQRTIFENILLAQMKNLPLKMLLVRGLPNVKENIFVEGIEIVNHLPAIELNNKIAAAKMVVARCGYSTVMDVAVLQQPAILVPTPGQTEQEYLAKYLAQKGYCFTANQAGFNIDNALKMSDNDLIPYPKMNDSLLLQAIEDLTSVL